ELVHRRDGDRRELAPVERDLGRQRQHVDERVGEQDPVRVARARLHVDQRFGPRGAALQRHHDGLLHQIVLLDGRLHHAGHLVGGTPGAGGDDDLDGFRGLPGVGGGGGERSAQGGSRDRGDGFAHGISSVFAPFYNSPMSAATPTADNSLRSDATVISLVGFAHGTSHFFHFVLPPLFPWLMRDFGLTFTQVGAAMTVFFVVSGIGQALAGFVVDRVGALRVLYGGVALLSVGGLLYSAAQSYPMLLAAAAVAGLGNSVFHPADYTLLNRRVSASRLGHAFSVHGLTGSLGWAAAPVFVLAVAQAMGWRAACMGASMIGFLALGFLFANRRTLQDAPRLLPGDGARHRGGSFAFLGAPV